MKKGLVITLLVIGGLIAAGALIIVAAIEIIEAVIGLIVWSVVIIVGYLIVKAKT